MGKTACLRLGGQASKGLGRLEFEAEAVEAIAVFENREALRSDASTGKSSSEAFSNQSVAGAGRAGRSPVRSTGQGP
ncbi:MAG: hypothetical protein ACR2PL_03635, partial [Dehalococcoidia bacterium]